MSGTKRPVGKDFDPPAIQPKQLRVDPPLGQAGVGQQFVLPGRHPLDATRHPLDATRHPLDATRHPLDTTRHPLDTTRHPLDASRRLSQGARIIGIPGILPNVSRQTPSTFPFPSPASAPSPLGLPIRSPLSAGGLPGISPNPQVHPNVPHLALPPFPAGVPPVVSTSHTQTPPTGVVALEPPFIPPEHVTSTTPLTLIRPGSPSAALTLPPRPLLAASPLAPPPPYPAGQLPHSSEEFTCSSPSQFLCSPTSVTAITSQPPEDANRAGGNPAKGDGLKKEVLPLAPAPSLPLSLSATPHLHTRTGTKRDHHSVKTKLLKHRKSRLATLKLRYEVQLKEMFFLEGGGNMMDFLQWKKRPNILREQYLKHHDIELETATFGQLSPKEALSLTASLKVSGLASIKMDPEHPLPEVSTPLATPSEVSTHKHTHKSSKASGGSTRSGHTKLDTSSSTRIQIPLSTVSPSLQVVSPLPIPTASTPRSTPSSPIKGLQISSPSPRPTTRAQLQTQASFSSVYETSHEDIVMRARHEAEVMRAIADLRKEGLWTTSRLPKVQEPSRKRILWDYLLEEMQWLATDFANERRWKINAARKLSRSMMKHHLEQSTLAQRSEKEELQRLRKIASSIAKEVKHFWESVRKRTRETLVSGNYLSVINILMQLRKVCNHPDLFEPRPIVSPFRMMAIQYYTASLVLHAMEYDPFKHVSLDHLNLRLADAEFVIEAFAAFRSSQLQPPRVYLLDPSVVLPHSVELGSGLGSELGVGATGREGAGDLHDLLLPGLVSRQEEWTLGRRKHMQEINSFRCQHQPMYGQDLVHTILFLCQQDPKKSPSTSLPLSSTSSSPWLWVGSLACQLLQRGVRPEDGGPGSLLLSNCLHSHEDRAVSMEGTIRRFSITIPPATAPGISLVTHHPPPSYLLRKRELASCLGRELPQKADLLHCAATASSLQFPETRLIQYDCGKLQTLDTLLHHLKVDTHRVLLFTQMARMLDILEIFLNYHGHTYLRLDGSTPPLKRQFLMDRFNRDKRIFCFILSTRSGGLGVNLTGADTVIFYDSDWNPTMDAQAQDRCHRIGQTRDVHIYRLVSERTVEENILKKAKQKKMLGDIAIEGGAFTTEFFKKASLRELFKLRQEDRVVTETAGDEESVPLSQKQIEEILANVEDDTDVQAARRARAEETAEMAEFDDTFTSQSSAPTEVAASAESQVQSEFAQLQEQLSGVEQYAVRYLEAERAHITSQELQMAEKNIELAKKDWELTHLQNLRAEEERLAEEEADDVLLTYDRPETANKRMVDRETGEDMPMWLPPTPPAEEDDEEELYIDPILGLSYDLTSTITPTVLAATIPFNGDDYDVFGLWRPAPQVVEPVKKSHQKSSMKKMKESVNVPPSLFWRRMAADCLPTKLRKLTSHHSKKAKNKDSFTPLLEQHPEGPEWIYYEDWVLLKCITAVLEFPLSLTISVPAQIPNWSIVSDLTSGISKVKRSPLQCREHLMNTVIPREDPSVKGEETESKKHKSKDGSIRKTKVRKEQRTKGLILADSGRELTKQYSSSFDWVLTAASKRNQQAKFAWESLQKHSMHSDLLKDYGIMVDVVHSPMHIAQQRAERLQSVVAARAYQTASTFPKVGTTGLPTPTDITKLGTFNLPGNRGVSAVSTPSLPSRVPLPTSLSSAPTAATVGTPVSLPITTAQKTALTLASTAPSHLPTTTHSLPLPSSSSPHPLTTSTPTPSTPLTAISSVAKSYSTSDLGKIVPPFPRNFNQQLFLLRHQQTQHQAASVQSPPNPLPRLQTPQQSLGTQKVTLPAGIEQLRPSVSLPLQQRFSAAVTSAANAMRNITSRSLQTEEVLALLKQQSLRMAASQSYRAAHPTQLQPRESGLPVAAQIQQVRPELSKASILLSTEALSKYQPAAEGGHLKVELLEQGRVAKTQGQQLNTQQTQPRVVQVPMTTATSLSSVTASTTAPSPVTSAQPPPPTTSSAVAPPPTPASPPPAPHHTTDTRTTSS